MDEITRKTCRALGTQSFFFCFFSLMLDVSDLVNVN